MSATTEPTLFDPRPRDAESAAQAPVQAGVDAVSEAQDDASDAEAAAAQPEGAEGAEAADGEKSVPDRKRLTEQLETLKRKEAEIRRALAVTDHPELADAIRSIEAKVYCVTRAEGKIAQGFSKSEARRREVIEKKLTSLREKRTELDTQISAFEEELAGLGAQRMAEFETERKSALKDLMLTLATHDAALVAAGYEAQSLMPEISGWMPELEAAAREVTSVASA